MQQSNQLFEQSLEAIPGGVNSPVRAFQGVGGTPVFIARGKGSRLYDVDDREYVDYVCSWGAMIVGHAHKDVVAAAAAAATSGISFGAPTEIEYRFADTIRRAMPSIEMVRAVNSGTEATMSAIRLARGYTGRDLLIKFAGCYHGHADSLLVAAGSGVLTQGLPASEGVPAAAVADTLVLPYNDAQAVTDAFLQYGERIATVIVEPIAGNMNLVRGNDDFLRTLRQQTEKYGSVLIFDEVMSGFRVAAGGAQQLLNIRPDLTCLGKVIGGGLGVAAFGGRQDIMHTLAPLGSVYQAGTLSGNPVALSAGLATLDIVLQEGFHDNLHAATARLTKGLTDAANQSDTPFCCDHIGGMWGMYFRSTPPQNLSEAQDVNMISFRQFFHLMLKKGFYFAPSSYEAGFISAAHNDADIQSTQDAAAESFTKIKETKKQ